MNWQLNPDFPGLCYVPFIHSANTHILGSVNMPLSKTDQVSVSVEIPFDVTDSTKKKKGDRK